ncbi:Fc.00g044880.m01.CDS01 [Cosmosporella sp. VM-42]
MSEPKKSIMENHDHDEHFKTLSSESDAPVVAIDATLDAAGGAPNPWGKGHVQLYMLCVIIYLCSTMNGYDGSLMGSINSIPEYQKYYGLGPEGTATTGIVFSIFQIGQMIGALFTWVCDWHGRKRVILVACFGIIASAIFTALAPTLSSFIGARFLLSYFSTIACAVAPLLLVEISPPLYRGTVAGTYNTLYYMGSIIATFTIYGANLHLSGDIKWRLPLWLQMICPGLVCLLGWMLPESPRWLISKGRHEEARAFIVKYHANGEANHPIVGLEMREIEVSLGVGKILKAKDYFDLRSLIKTQGRRYRVMLAVTMAWFGQFSGNNISSYYLPFMVQNVGITSLNMILLLNAIYAVTGWVAATIGARFHDIFGRRKMLMTSCAGLSICLAIVAATASEYERSGSVPASSASIAFIFIFGVVFAIAFTPMQPIYPAEVLGNDMRPNGMMLFQITSGAAGFVNTFAAPVALTNIRYWFYVFFVFWDIFELIFIYFFFVETRGRTLEELDEVFEYKNPRKASTRKGAVQDLSRA